MNKRVRKKWVKALRSGEYAQGTGVLCTVGRVYDTFCCLGVLTDLYLLEKGDGWDEEENGKCMVSRSFDNTDINLPTKVAWWAELSSNDGYYTKDKSLMHDNDEHKLNFNQLADIIEANF